MWPGNQIGRPCQRTEWCVAEQAVQTEFRFRAFREFKSRLIALNACVQSRRTCAQCLKAQFHVLRWRESSVATQLAAQIRVQADYVVTLTPCLRWWRRAPTRLSDVPFIVKTYHEPETQCRSHLSIRTAFREGSWRRYCHQETVVT